MKTEANTPAFPLDHDCSRMYMEGYGSDCWGLTKREYFAAAALQGMLAAGRDWHPKDLTRKSLEYADAMLEEIL